MCGVVCMRLEIRWHLHCQQLTVNINHIIETESIKWEMPNSLSGIHVLRLVQTHQKHIQSISTVVFLLYFPFSGKNNGTNFFISCGKWLCVYVFFSVGKYFGKAEITIRQIEKRKTPTEMVINVVVSPTHFGPKRRAQTTTARARWKKENNSRRKVGAVHSIWKLFQNKVTYPSGYCLCVCGITKKTQVFSTRRRLKRKKIQPTSRENSMFKGKRVAQRSEWNERLFRLRANKMNVRIKEREKKPFQRQLLRGDKDTSAI